MEFLTGGLGAISSLIGGLFGQSNQAKINQQNIQAQQQINAQNIAEQEKFAQMGVQWKVADAKAAGINPLAALGANTASFSNVVAPQAEASNELGKGIREAGQDLSRAAAASAAENTRSQMLANKLTEARIRNEDADTVSKLHTASDTARTFASPGTPPGIPLPRPNTQAPGYSYERANAKPLTEAYVTDQGALVHLPTASASTASQNWMSMPGQITGAAQLAGEQIYDAYKSLKLPVEAAYNSIPTLRPDIYRAFPSYAPVPY